MARMSSRRNLSDDIETLQRLVTERRAIIESTRATLLSREVEIEKLRIELLRLKRLLFGRSSEQPDDNIAQLELSLEELEASESRQVTPPALPPHSPEHEKPARRALPAHLPRETLTHFAPSTCPDCGGALNLRGTSALAFWRSPLSITCQPRTDWRLLRTTLTFFVREHQ